MRNAKCIVYADSNSNHLQQVYTGLTMLHRQGVLNVDMRVSKEARKTKTPFSVQNNILHLELAGKKLCFDTSDSALIDSDALERCDFLFKRSFNPNSDQVNYSENVLPYGLNYLVYADGFDRFAFKRCALFYHTKDWKKELIKQADFLGKLHYKVSTSALYSRPVLRENPKILFLARLWDTHTDSFFTVTEEQRLQREQINKQRVECIAMLQEAFKDKFTGGLIATDFALKEKPKLVLKNTDLTSKKNYINTVKSHDICIASTGLHGSIGWKFGEYIAMSKAIVSEQNENTVRGLKSNIHFQEFSSATECVERVKGLVEGHDDRFEMMKQNHLFYESHLRPDKLLMRCFRQAL
ncbi:hypothetical protein [Alteromonas macleodii]|uniref:hypothetical protein n=1 Tax=Alteromonas macleodii TaxID=28108 RepID=UPI0031402ECA